MIRKFIGRENELAFLENEFKKDGQSVIVIYGRRRVGKTELIKKFISGKPGIYFLASREPSHLQLQRLIKKITDHINEREPKIEDWIDGIDYIGEIMKKHNLLIAIDEFPYLIESNSSVSSYFQRLNDEYLVDSNSMLILSGSSISMMESEVLGQKSPLHGRRTGQIDLGPFDFEKASLLIEKSIEDKIIVYAIFGNIPMYVSFFDNEKTIIDNIFENVLNKNTFLYKEPEFILKQELREPANYMSILSSIASGNTRLNEIANKTRMSPGTLSKYMDQLIRLRLISREVPVTERSKKSKKSLYVIEDNLFKFWFKFIEPNISDVENNPQEFLEQSIVPQLPQYVSSCFEKICEEYVMKNEHYGKVGRWWHKNTEIDIVGLNEKTKHILFAECKWQTNVDAKKIVSQLKEKAKQVKWHNDTRKEHYMIFAKSFSSKNIPENVKLVDLRNIDVFFTKK